MVWHTASLILIFAHSNRLQGRNLCEEGQSCLNGNAVWMAMLSEWQCCLNGNAVWMAMLSEWQCCLNGNAVWMASTSALSLYLFSSSFPFSFCLGSHTTHIRPLYYPSPPSVCSCPRTCPHPCNHPCPRLCLTFSVVQDVLVAGVFGDLQQCLRSEILRQVCGTADAVVHRMQVAVVGGPQPNIPVTAHTDGLYRMLSIQKTRVL